MFAAWIFYAAQSFLKYRVLPDIRLRKMLSFFAQNVVFFTQNVVFLRKMLSFLNLGSKKNYGAAQFL